MNLIILAILIAITSAIWFPYIKKADKKVEEGNWEFNGLKFLVYVHGVLAVACLFVLVVLTMSTCSDQLSDQEEIKRVSEVKIVYQERAESLTKSFSEYLSNQYPKYEKSIFEKIKPSNIDLYLVKYPEIKSSETIIALVKQIRELQDEVYKQSVLKEETLKNMRYRTKNPWILNSFIPEISE